MALGIVTLADTFNLASVTRLNSLILLMNELTEGQHNSSGIITLTGGGFRDNVTMNVANGQIKGDGGAIYNVGASFTKISGQANNTLIQNSYMNLVSNVGSLIIVRGNTWLGNTTYLTLNIASSFNDQSTINLAYIGAVNAVSNVAAAAYDKANAANILAFSQNVTPAFHAANGAFLQANLANVLAVGNTLSNGYFVQRASRSKLNFIDAGVALTWKVDDDSSGDRVNVTLTSAVSSGAYDKANNANITADIANNVANLAFNKANVANGTADAAFARANADIISLLMNGPLTAYNNANVIPYCTYPFNIDYAYYRIGAGSTVRIQVRNGTTNVTNLSALSTTTAGKINVATGLNSFAVGDRLQITLTGQSSSEQNLEVVFAITRT